MSEEKSTRQSLICAEIAPKCTCVCAVCSEYISYPRHSSERERRLLKAARAKGPISKTEPERIKLTLQGQRLQCAEYGIFLGSNVAYHTSEETSPPFSMK